MLVILNTVYARALVKDVKYASPIEYAVSKSFYKIGTTDTTLLNKTH